MPKHASKAFQNSVNELHKRYKEFKLDKIVAIESRGFIWGSVLAYKLSLPLIIARKEGKLPRNTIKQSYSLEYNSSSLEIHKDAIKKGDRILLFDDVLATGGTASAVTNLVKNLGGIVVECSFLVDIVGLQKVPEIKKHKTFSLLHS